MERKTETTSRDVYLFSEAEFKALLGITGPEHVLQVSSTWTDSTVTVYMSKHE